MKRLLVALTILASAGASTQAGLIFSDSFNYPDGGVVSNSAGVWVQNSGNAGTCLVSNNALQIWNNSGTRTEDIAHQFVPGYTHATADALYARFTAKWTGDQFPTLNGTYFFSFASSGITYFMARTWAGTTNLATSSAAPDGYFYVGIGNNSPSGSIPQGPASGQLNSVLLTTNVTYTIVVRHVLSTGLDTVWVGTDPATMSETGTPSATANDTPSTSSNVVNYVNFRQAAGEGTIVIDDLKVGTAFADVAGANTSPQVSQIPNQSIPANGNTGALPFTVQDAETAAASLTVSAVSSNTVLVPNANVVLGGSGTDRTITVTPAAGEQGSAEIWVFVSDSVNTSAMHFTVTVGAPVLSAIPNQITYSNVAVTAIPLTVTDPEGDSFTFSATSGNTNLLKPENVVVTGSGSSYSVALTPEAGQYGWARVTISANDGHNTSSTVFILTVSPRLGLVFSDNFAYTDWTFVPNALSQATGSPWVTASGTPYEIQVTNGWAYLVSTNGEDVGAWLNNPLAGASATPYGTSNGVVFYTSFKANFSLLPSYSGTYFFHLKNTDMGTTFYDRLFARTNGAAPGKFRIGIANYSGSVSATFPQDLDLGTEYTVVTRYNSATGESVLWLNPSTAQSASVAATDTPNTSAVGAVGLRQSSGYGNLTLGALKIGTEFSDVVSYVSPTPIPLHIAYTGGNVVLTWDNPVFSLQAAPAVTGTYTNVPDAASGYSVPAGASQMFFRLMAP